MHGYHRALVNHEDRVTAIIRPIATKNLTLSNQPLALGRCPTNLHDRKRPRYSRKRQVVGADAVPGRFARLKGFIIDLNTE